MHIHMHSPAMFWPECDKPSCAGRSPKHDSFSRSDRRGQTYVRITRAEVEAWLVRAGLEDVVVRPNCGWVATGRKPAATIA